MPVNEFRKKNWCCAVKMEQLRHSFHWQPHWGENSTLIFPRALLRAELGFHWSGVFSSVSKNPVFPYHGKINSLSVRKDLYLSFKENKIVSFDALNKDKTRPG